MDAYFDTSALVPLVVAEPASLACLQVWDAADTIVSSPLAYVELHAALAQASRLGRLDDAARHAAIRGFEARWAEVVAIPPNDDLVRSAAGLAASHALRGYDAVHCATALAAASDDFVAVTGDRELAAAWSTLGIPTVMTHR